MLFIAKGMRFHSLPLGDDQVRVIIIFPGTTFFAKETFPHGASQCLPLSSELTKIPTRTCDHHGQLAESSLESILWLHWPEGWVSKLTWFLFCGLPRLQVCPSEPCSNLDEGWILTSWALSPCCCPMTPTTPTPTTPTTCCRAPPLLLWTSHLPRIVSPQQHPACHDTP